MTSRQPIGVGFGPHDPTDEHGEDVRIQGTAIRGAVALIAAAVTLTACSDAALDEIDDLAEEAEDLGDEAMDEVEDELAEDESLEEEPADEEEPAEDEVVEEGGRDDPELVSMQAFVQAFEAGDRDAASEVASTDVLDEIEHVYGWGGQAAQLVFVNADGSVADDYYTCDDCGYYFETGGDSWNIELDGDFIVGIAMGG